MVDAWRRQCGDALLIDYDETLNPLRWELGHIGWFEEWWLARNADRLSGTQANPGAMRKPSIQRHGDRWYNSSTVEHGSRWTLDLPTVDRILDDVARQRESSLALLRALPADASDDVELYFYRLALMHEDMHAEAWVMMAQQLGFDPGDGLSHLSHPHESLSLGVAELAVQGGEVELGAGSRAGFAFDNELGQRRVEVEAFSIDAAPVSWSRFLPFVDAGGYEDPRWWSPAGLAWRESHRAAHPRYLRRRRDGHWEQQRFDRWADVVAAEPASHLTFHEAQAWCRWAGRALPTEAQWRAAQHQHSDHGDVGGAFQWGAVWEWTASPFEPFEGFQVHPYRDYSQPWFDGRPVLKGASAWTHPHLRHPAYRNYFLPHRNDVMAGFRSVAVRMP